MQPQALSPGMSKLQRSKEEVKKRSWKWKDADRNIARRSSNTHWNILGKRVD
jgi:hypothetical protein